MYFSISISKNNTIYKSLQGLQGHHEHTHNQTENTAEGFVEIGLQRSSGSSGFENSCDCKDASGKSLLKYRLSLIYQYQSIPEKSRHTDPQLEAF